MTGLLGMAVTGIFIAGIYDVFRMFRKALKKGTGRICPSGVVHVQDVLFWMGSMVIFILALYVNTGGMIRWYTVAAFVLGMVIYKYPGGKISSKILYYILLVLVYVFRLPFLLFNKFFLKKD